MKHEWDEVRCLGVIFMVSLLLHLLSDHAPVGDNEALKSIKFNRWSSVDVGALSTARIIVDVILSVQVIYDSVTQCSTILF